MKTFHLIETKSTEVFTYHDIDGKVWTIEFENNEFKRTSYDLKSPYTRKDWAKLAEFAQIIEDLCKTKDTKYEPDRVMNQELDVDAEEEAWQELETKHGLPKEGNA